MNINTDLVKRKRFIDPIKSSIQKCCQEYRVLATLRYLYPAQFEEMIKDESPDLQDRKNNIGIEVTVAVNNNDMKASRVFSELNQIEPEESEKQKRIVESCGYSFVPIQDNKTAIAKTGTSNEEKTVFQDSIHRKIKKIQQYRKKNKRIGLAILLPEIPTSYAESHFSVWIHELFDNTDNQFDFVFVISHRFCIHYDVQSNREEKKLLTQEENRSLSTIGRMTAEGDLTIMDTEWL